MAMIKYCKDFDMPKEGENVVKMAVPYDLSLMAFQVAWMTANTKNGSVLMPKNMYANFYVPSMVQVLEPVFTDSFNIIATSNQDEWWMDFEDSDVIFYSPGA